MSIFNYAYNFLSQVFTTSSCEEAAVSNPAPVPTNQEDNSQIETNQIELCPLIQAPAQENSSSSSSNQGTNNSGDIVSYQQPLPSTDFLPNEIIQHHIFPYLDAFEKINCQKISRQFEKVFNDFLSVHKLEKKDAFKLVVIENVQKLNPYLLRCIDSCQMVTVPLSRPQPNNNHIAWHRTQYYVYVSKKGDFLGLIKGNLFSNDRIIFNQRAIPFSIYRMSINRKCTDNSLQANNCPEKIFHLKFSSRSTSDYSPESYSLQNNWNNNDMKVGSHVITATVEKLDTLFKESVARIADIRNMSNDQKIKIEDIVPFTPDIINSISHSNK